jgi:hypothetical protein
MAFRRQFVFTFSGIPRVIKPLSDLEIWRSWDSNELAGETIRRIPEIELLTKGKRRHGLLAAAEAMFTEDFADRVFVFESDAARTFFKIAAQRRALGDLSATRMRRLQPFPKCGGQASDAQYRRLRALWF